MLRDPRLTDETLIRRFYLLAFTRPPTDAELDHARMILSEASDRASGAQDLFWALLNSKEFLFNH